MLENLKYKEEKIVLVLCRSLGGPALGLNVYIYMVTEHMPGWHVFYSTGRIAGDGKKLPKIESTTFSL